MIKMENLCNEQYKSLKKSEFELAKIENSHVEQINKLKDELESIVSSNNNSDLIPEMIPPEQTYNIFFCNNN